MLTWPGWNAPPTSAPGSRDKSTIRNTRTEEGPAPGEREALVLSETGYKPTLFSKMDQERIETNSHGEAKLAAELEATPDARNRRKVSPADMIYALEMTIACAISYWITTSGLTAFVDKASDFLGGILIRVSLKTNTVATTAHVAYLRDSRV